VPPRCRREGQFAGGATAHPRPRLGAFAAKHPYLWFFDARGVFRLQGLVFFERTGCAAGGVVYFGFIGTLPTRDATLTFNRSLDRLTHRGIAPIHGHYPPGWREQNDH
jgi:hypothetical protein